MCRVLVSCGSFLHIAGVGAGVWYGLAANTVDKRQLGRPASPTSLLLLRAPERIYVHVF